MASNAERDSYGITVDGVYRRPILPEKVVDVGRYEVNVKANGTIQGGVLCGNLAIEEGPFAIEGPVLALGSLRATCSQGQGVICGPAVARDSLLVETQLRDRPAVRFLGDVSSRRLNVQGGFVYGNVFGTNLALSNCVVLGVIFAHGHMKLENVLCFTFLADEVEVAGSVSILHCAATAASKLDLGGTVRSLAFTSWEEVSDEALADAVVLREDDLKHLDCEREDGTSESMYLLNCFDRIVNVTERTSQLADNISWMEACLAECRAAGHQQQAVRGLEASLWRCMSAPTDQGATV